MDWQIGDIARCKAGGPNMMVKETSEKGILCEWIDEQKRYQSGTFAPTSLEAPELHEIVTI
jgi:uncharacterized protein YodC (DUF2158 family)